MRKYAVIVAAGSGSRMGNPVPKQFLNLLGKPVLIHSVNAFAAAYPDISIILVVHPLYLADAQKMIAEAGHSERTTFVAGADTRSGSVRKGLENIPGDGVVMVHDAARCAVSPQLIRRCAEQAILSGSAIPVVPVTDSVRMIAASGSTPVDRSQLRLVQTPQAFHVKLLRDAYALVAGRDFTDDATVFENAGLPLTLVEGEATNIKITRSSDLLLMEHFMKAGDS